jgi:hypothetical protein
MKNHKSIILKKAWEFVRKFCLSVKDAMLRAWNWYRNLVKCTVISTHEELSEISAKVYRNGWAIESIIVYTNDIINGMIYDNFSEYLGTKRYVIQ